MRRSRFSLLWLLVCLAALGLLLSQARRPNALVVYCAHDAVFAEEILKAFERRTGIAVVARFDTEATKSLGLTELLIAEKSAPRCDVFWDNEMLGMMDLQQRGLLMQYKGVGFARIPDAWKDAEGYWTGFAARLRVWIYRPRGLSASAAQQEIDARMERGDLSRVAIAKPLYGTTLTHYSLLWQEWGGARLQSWHRENRRRGLREVNGNGAVRDLVAAGVCDFGLTDTDDFFEAKDEGKEVAALPVRLGNSRTVCIPNTVALIRGAPHEAAARTLIDFLLSAETELALARSKSRQVPLGPLAAADLPAEVQELSAWARDGADLRGAGAARTACLGWLRAEYRQ